jgi:hypothetical protein
MQGTQTALREGRKPKSRRGWVILGGILGTLLLIVWMWWRGLTALPNAPIPNPTLPSPNGFDALVAACNNIQDEKAVGEAMATRPVAGQKVYTQAEKEALVAKNAATLKQLRAALPMEYLHPPARSMATLFPHYAKFRSMARLLMLEGQVHATHGDWDKALQSNLDAMELGIVTPRGSVLIGQLVGIACEAIGRRFAWDTVEKLNTAEAKAAAHRLEKMLARRFPYADTLQEEKWFGQGALMEIFRDPNWRNRADLYVGMTSASGTEEWSEKISRIGQQAQLHLYSNATLLNNYTGYMDAISARARQPYATQGPQPAQPNDPLSAIFLPVFSQAEIKDLTAQTQDTILLTALALRAYHVEHRAYPTNLQALVPAYLSKLPADPFGTQEFAYQRKGNTYLLYSVGPDRQDNGGTPIDNPSGTSSTSTTARYLVNVGSQGDVVMGVNKY